MLAKPVKRRLIHLQVRLSMWLTHLCTDSYDVIRYEPQIHSLLSRLNIDYQAFATVPWFDYCNSFTKTWSIFVLQNGEWHSMRLPNPFHAEHKAEHIVVASELVTDMKPDVSADAAVHSVLHA